MSRLSSGGLCWQRGVGSVSPKAEVGGFHNVLGTARRLLPFRLTHPECGGVWREEVNGGLSCHHAHHCSQAVADVGRSFHTSTSTPRQQASDNGITSEEQDEIWLGHSLGLNSERGTASLRTCRIGSPRLACNLTSCLFWKVCFFHSRCVI